MITYEEALALVLANARPLTTEWVALTQALGRYLARDVIASDPVPRFDQSSMDGYGVRAEDLQGADEARPVSLRVAGEIRAGDDAGRCALGPGHAVRIFTGAPIPRGVDAVMMQEVCERSGETVLIRQVAPVGNNIRRMGEEFQKGARVLATGTRVTPPAVGLLAALGPESVEVYRWPRVALIATGSELAAPGEWLEPGQVRDANTPALTAALVAMGIEPVMAVRVVDDREAIRSALAAALDGADIVLTVGGVSVGDYDFVKDVAAGLGVKAIYWQVAIKPGMPNYLGTSARGKGNKAPARLLFGLPGNPVAALVSFHLFVRPALLKMTGAPDPRPRFIVAKLSSELKKKHERLEWVRGVMAAGEKGELAVSPTSGQESHMLGGLAAANCLIEFPADRDVLAQGDKVRVMMLDWTQG